MLRKNTAGQFIHFTAVNATTGAALTGAGSLAGRRCLDGTFAALGGTITEDTGLGFYKIALTQADTNGNNCAFFITATNMVPVCINVITTACDPTSTAFGLSLAKTTNITGFNDIAAPTGFAAATFPVTVASTTNITAAAGIAVSSLGAGVITAASIAADAITDAKVAADVTIASVTGAVGSVTGAVGSVTGAVGSVTGLTASDVGAIKAKTDNLPASPAAVGSAMTLTAAYDFSKGTTAMTEAYAVNAAAPTPVQALFAIHQMLMDFAISGTNITVKKLDNATTAFVVGLDSAVTPTTASRT